MSEYEMYVRIDGEPFLSRVRKYHDELRAAHDAWWEFAKARGASKVPDVQKLTGLYFDHKAPDGWTKPVRKGWSQPKKDHPDVAALAALPEAPSRKDVFGDTLCFDLNWRLNDKNYGAGAIGRFWFGPRIGWASDVFFAIIPDAKKAADDHLAQHPDHTITSGADKWTLPAGLTQITKAQVDLILAQHAVRQEQDAVA